MIFNYTMLGLLLAMVTVLVARAVIRDRRWPRYHLMRELDPDWQHVREALRGQPADPETDRLSKPHYRTSEREG